MRSRYRPEELKGSGVGVRREGVQDALKPGVVLNASTASADSHSMRRMMAVSSVMPCATSTPAAGISDQARTGGLHRPNQPIGVVAVDVVANVLDDHVSYS